jgi:hypothetical protein
MAETSSEMAMLESKGIDGKCVKRSMKEGKRYDGENVKESDHSHRKERGE